MLSASERAYSAVVSSQRALDAIVLVVQVPQLDIQRTALSALCSLVPSSVGGTKSARHIWSKKEVPGSTSSQVRFATPREPAVDFQPLDCPPDWSGTPLGASHRQDRFYL